MEHSCSYFVSHSCNAKITALAAPVDGQPYLSVGCGALLLVLSVALVHVLGGALLLVHGLVLGLVLGVALGVVLGGVGGVALLLKSIEEVVTRDKEVVINNISSHISD